MASIGLSPIGLIFAAILAVILAFGEVCNKKIVQGENVVSAVFWIRLFSLLEIIAVMMVFAWRGSPPLIHPAASIAEGDLGNIPALVNYLKNPANDAELNITGKLSASTLTELRNYRSGGSDAEISKSLSQDLNSSRIIEGSLLYNAHDFAGVALSAETRRVLANKPHGETQAYANRLLLEDMFPGAIRKNRGSALFGMQSVIVSSRVAFATYLLIEVILIACSQLLTSFALKVSAISLCIPFTTFTPLFIMGTGYVVLRELPTSIELLGIGLIVMGGILMHRKRFAVSWKAPILAIFKEKGSRYILLATLIGSVNGPIEKQLILMSDPLTTAFGYGIGTVVAFGILLKAMHIDVKQVIRQKPGWAVLAGLADANTMFAQFIAVMYLPVVITICIKRAGIVLTILAGWLIFKEHEITDRLIAAMAMMGGIAIFYLPLEMMQALTLTSIVIAAVAMALFLTRYRPTESALASESIL